MDQPDNTSDPQPRPFPAYPQPPQNPAAVGLPIISGYQLVQPLNTSGDGALWLAGHVESGAMVGVAFLNQYAQADPAAVLRMKQELAQHLPDNQPRLLVVNPPLDAAAAVQRGGAARNTGGKGSGMGVLAIVLGCSGFAIILFIVSILATIAVPSFLRARHRSQATKIVNDARIYEAAVDQWAIENNKEAIDTYRFVDISDYIKPTSELVISGGSDILGNPYVTGTVRDGVKVHPDSYDELSDVTTPDFWGSYAPTSGGSSSSMVP